MARRRARQSFTLVKTDEKDLPASQPPAKKNPRLHGTDGDDERAQRSQAPARQGTPSPPRHDSAQAARLRTPVRKPQSFCAADRLHRSSEFARLQRNGVRAHSAHFVIYAGRLDQDQRSRLGITASRRVGNAVVRNRLKRRVREWFRRTLRPTLPAGTSILVIARPGAGELATAQLLAELGSAMQNIMRKLIRG